MWLIQLGEVIFGGVGSGLYGMLVFAIVAVFIAGLMVGRTPEYLGKKIEAFEMKMASLFILIPPFCALVGTAIAVSLAAGRAGTANPGAHGFCEILYAFSSAAGNNGSAFAGLSANTPFYNIALGHRHVGRRASGRSCRCWRSPAAWPPRSTCPRAPARCRPTRRCSSCCWRRGRDRRRAGLLPGAGARARSSRSCSSLHLHRQSDIAASEDSPSTTAQRASRPLFDPPLVKAAIRDSFLKLAPWVQWRNPVMFVVLVGSVLITALWLAQLGGHLRAEGSPGFVLAIALWLWATLLFANFAESLAEGRGKAQAASLRASKRDVTARRFPSGRTDQPPRDRALAQLRRGRRRAGRRPATPSPATARSSRAPPRSMRAPSPASPRP